MAIFFLILNNFFTSQSISSLVFNEIYIFYVNLHFKYFEKWI
jgi:hypothetical protein